MNDLDYLRLSKPQKLLHNLGKLLKSLPGRVGGFFLGIVMFFWKLIKGIGLTIADLVMTYIRGDWKTKISYTVMGFGSIMRGQWLRGILFFVFQTVFNCYLWFFGLGYVMKLGTLGTVDTTTADNGAVIYGDDSFLIMLYGVLTIFFIMAFIYTWYVNIKQNKISEQILKSGKPLKSAKDDMHSLLDNQFHKTLLAIPTLGVTVFTILPIIFMILVAFTNYDHDHQPPGKRFQWVGLQNFETLLVTKETPVVLSNVNEDPASKKAGFEVKAKNGDTFALQVDEESRALITAAQELLLMPMPEYPLEGSSADGFTLIPHDNAKRSACYLILNTPEGSKLTLTCKKNNAGYNGIMDTVNATGTVYSFVLAEADAKGQQALTVTAGETVYEMVVTKIEAVLAPDPRAEFALEYDEEQPLAVSSTESDGKIRLVVDNTDGKTLVGFLPLEQAENVEKAKSIVAAGGEMNLEKATKDILGNVNKDKKDEDGNLIYEEGIIGQSYTFTMEFTGGDESVTLVVSDGARETFNGTITFLGAAERVEEGSDAFDPNATAAAAAIPFAEARAARAAEKAAKDEIAAIKNLPKEVEAANAEAAKALTDAETARAAGDEESAVAFEEAAVAAQARAAELQARYEADSLRIPELQAQEKAEGERAATLEATAATESAKAAAEAIAQGKVALRASEIRLTEQPSMPKTFTQVLLWTLIWAFFATFLNYFLGMLVAIMINKKGIKLKKLWRTVLVMTIAIPQFISLLYVSKMFAADGLINGTLMSWGWIKEPLPFWTNATWAKCTIIGINIWIGIPYLMLIATGILMNIPADLYESARIDGANAFQTYMKITLPYMLFVTGPYLLTSFTGNINNFNVIFLLSQGKPLSMDLMGNAGNTDLLITWLYKMTVTDSNYKLAAVMGILVFVVCAVINLVVYNLIPSVKNEEDFQ